MSHSKEYLETGTGIKLPNLIKTCILEKVKIERLWITSGVGTE
jgi:hypothetical protein